MDKYDDYEYSDKLAQKLSDRLDKLFDKFATTDSFDLLSEEQQEEASFVIQTFGDYMFSYHGELEKDWSPESVEECCTETLQRKVSAENIYYESIVPVLDKFLKFLEEQNVITNSEILIKCLKRIEKRVVANAADPAYWGMAKSMVMRGQAQGYDMFSEEGAAEYMEAYNNSLDLPPESSITQYRNVEKTGRNDPCICGSGKKYKKCCLNK